MNKRSDLPENRVELHKIINADREEIKRMKEEIRFLRKALFGPKSEKLPAGDSPQLPLFDMPENLPEEKEEPKKVVVPAHTRVKRGRKPLPENLPRVEVIHDIPEKDKVCACGHHLQRIGEEVSEKLDIIPAKIQVIRHIRPQYACRACEGAFDDSKTVKIAPVPAQIIPKGLATAGLLSHVLIGKFCDALPFYRQEKQFIRLGIDIPRQTMCNWAMKASDACENIMELLHEEIRGGPLLNADETTVQVLKEPGRSPTQKSYMWVFRGGALGQPIVIFQYHSTRSAAVAEAFFAGYKGVVQTDSYAGYNFLDKLDDILHVACWAHARRKFFDAKKVSGSKKTGSSDKALTMIRKLYGLERQAKNEDLSPSEIYKMRQRHAKPILDEFKSWLDERLGQVPPKSLLGKAIGYSFNQWIRLSNYIKDGHAGIDNNVAENAIRPFVVGRKNWLFSGTPTGARASATLFSLIETAKANNLEPYAYLRYLFEKLPTTPKEDQRELLPMNLKPQDLVLPDVATGV